MVATEFLATEHLSNLMPPPSSVSIMAKWKITSCVYKCFFEDENEMDHHPSPKGQTNMNT